MRDCVSIFSNYPGGLHVTVAATWPCTHLLTT